MRTIDPEHNWFWQQGYLDCMAGERPVVPDEARRLSEDSDYIAGYAAGEEEAADQIRAHQRDAIVSLLRDVLEADDAQIAVVLREQGLGEGGLTRCSKCADRPGREMTELERAIAEVKANVEARLETIAQKRRLAVFEEDSLREELAEIAAFSKLLKSEKNR